MMANRVELRMAVLESCVEKDYEELSRQRGR